MIIGIIGCLSTTGFIVFGISLILYMDLNKVLNRKTLAVIVLVVIVGYILFYASGTRIGDRANATIDDRTVAIEYSLQALKNKPIFGYGFYSTMGNANIQTGVCAVASMGQIGIFGFLLWLIIFGCAFAESASKKRFLYTNAAFFITALFSQPLIFAPAMYWLLFVDYDDNQLLIQRKRKQIMTYEKVINHANS